MSEVDYPAISPVKPPTETLKAPVETKEVDKSNLVTSEPNELPPSLESQPYLIKMLGIGEAKDHFEMPQLISEANQFVLTEMQRLKLADTPANYEKVMDKYLDKLPQGLDQYTLMEQLVDLMRIDKKLVEAMEEKERILSTDITNLTSSQLRKKIEHESRSN